MLGVLNIFLVSKYFEYFSKKEVNPETEYFDQESKGNLTFRKDPIEVT